MNCIFLITDSDIFKIAKIYQIGDFMKHLKKKKMKYSFILGQLNQETQEHCKRVSHMCEKIAPYVGLDSCIAYKIGLLHDAGKIFIPSRILKKNHGLTHLERDIIDMHSYYGYRMLKELGEGPLVYMPVLFHHGFWKFKLHIGEEPFTEEMMYYTCLVHTLDIYDAMASRRVYHAPATKDEIMEVLSTDDMCPNILYETLKSFDFPSVNLYSKLPEKSCTEN